MAITRADILSSSESNSVDQIKIAQRKITVIPPRDGSSMAPNFFAPITCSNDEVHCYFPFSDNVFFSIAEMIKKVREERPTKRIHHIELTLSLFNTGVVVNETNSHADMASSPIAENSNCSSDNKSQAIVDEEDDDDQWTDISSDEMDTEPEEETRSSAPNAASVRPDQVNTITNGIREDAFLIDEPKEKSGSTQSSNPNIVCTECGKRFKRPWSLKDHMITHSTERPFKCTTCGKCFKRQCALNQHQQQVHMKDSYSHTCGKCGRKFLFRSHLTKHMLKTHGEGLNNLKKSRRRRKKLTQSRSDQLDELN